MKYYRINNSTIALIKKDNKTIIIDKYSKKIIDNNILKIINNNCLIHGSDLECRKKIAAKILNIKYKLPIIINNNIIFIQLKSLRNNNTYLLALDKIIRYKRNNNYLSIYCNNNYIININISIYSLEKLLINGLLIKNALKSEKNANFV